MIGSKPFGKSDIRWTIASQESSLGQDATADVLVQQF